MKEIPFHLGYDLKIHKNNTQQPRTIRWVNGLSLAEREIGQQLMSDFKDKVIRRKSKVFFISPHYDDNPLSTGELTFDLAQALPGNVHVINIFTQNSMNPFDAITAMRKAEDARSSQILGVQTHSLDYVDAASRPVVEPTKMRQRYIDHYGKTQIYPYHTQLLGKISKYDNPLAQDLAVSLAEKVNEITDGDNNFVVIAPVGIVGNISHVDHVLTRNAANEAFGDSENLIFYADYPYLISGKPPHQFISDKLLTPALYRGVPEVRRRAAACHESQIPVLFKNRFLTNGKSFPETLPQEVYFLK